MACAVKRIALPCLSWQLQDYVRLIIIGTIGVVSAVLAPTNGARADEPLTVLYFERPPYYIKQAASDRLGGLVGGRANAALERSGIPYLWEARAANRHLRQIKANQRPVCALGWFKTKAREAFGQFTRAVYTAPPMVVVFRKTDPRIMSKATIRGLVSTSGLRLGTKLGFSYGSYTDRLLKAHSTPQVKTTQDLEGMLRMLAAGRFDYVFASQDEAQFLMQSTFGHAKELAWMTLSDAPKGQERFLICSKSVPQSVIAKLNIALEASD